MESLILGEESQLTKFNVLVVCTGNVCRSPLAEVLLRQSLADLPITVMSAGTHALVGEPMQEKNQRIAATLGLSKVSAHRAKQITVHELREADLVLALDREHRRYIVELMPRLSRRTFTLREFARLASHVTSDDIPPRPEPTAANLLRNAVEAVAQRRGSLPLLDNPADEDVIDPYYKSDDVYQLSANQLVPAVKATAALLIDAVGEVTS